MSFEAIIKNNSQKKSDKILPQMKLISDLGIDSMGFVSIIVELEEEIGYEFPVEALMFNDETTVENLMTVYYKERRKNEERIISL